MKFAIVGGGIVGLATAKALLERKDDWKVDVLEKEDDVCKHQSGNNSGVIHCGLYYKPGSLKARYAVEGAKRMKAFCTEQNVAWEECGKLVVATNAEEEAQLTMLEGRGRENGLRGVQRLTPAEFCRVEPHAAGVRALHVPEEGIADYKGVAQALVRLISSAQGRVELNAKVTSLRRERGKWLVDVRGETREYDFLVNCAGLYSDRVSRLAAARSSTRVLPFRGEYYELVPEARPLVRHLIYPVPDMRFPFLGVHFTRMTSGGVEAGPNAVLALSREGYGKLDLNPRDLAEMLAFPGFWNIVSKHWRMGSQEYLRSFSRGLFCKALQKLVPDVREAHLVPGGAGVRAQAVLPSGELVYDFELIEDSGSVHVLNAPSPAATSSLVIGEEIARRSLSQIQGRPS